MGKGHPTFPGLQISRLGYRLLENGDKAPRGEIGEIDKFVQKVCGNKISKKELESLGGLLAHCSHMVDGDGTHSRR